MSVPAVDVTKEHSLSLHQAAKLIPEFRPGKPTHPATLARWIQKGVRTPDGRRVYLTAVRLGSRWLTSVEAVSRFVAELQPLRPPGSELEQPKGRRKATQQDAVERELAALGIPQHPR